MTPRARDPKRIAAGIVGTLAAATLAVGVLHMPFARGLLMRAGGCPMAGAKMSAAQADHARRMGLAAMGPATASRTAPARPALGFALDGTTLTDIHAWASREHVDCDDVREGFVKCSHVSPAALGRPDVEGPIDELALAFDPQGHLVNLTTLRMHLTPEQGARAAPGDRLVARREPRHLRRRDGGLLGGSSVEGRRGGDRVARVPLR